MTPTTTLRHPAGGTVLLLITVQAVAVYADQAGGTGSPALDDALMVLLSKGGIEALLCAVLWFYRRDWSRLAGGLESMNQQVLTASVKMAEAAVAIAAAQQQNNLTLNRLADAVVAMEAQAEAAMDQRPRPRP
jgi:hypothetical protein